MQRLGDDQGECHQVQYPGDVRQSRGDESWKNEQRHQILGQLILVQQVGDADERAGKAGDRSRDSHGCGLARSQLATHVPSCERDKQERQDLAKMRKGISQRYHDTHRRLFLELLREIQAMFSVETHAYCLMDNHYHLLVRTPKANLSRAMRHLNGLYTQRYNRIEKTDGPLYRGRYKAILIDADAYLLNVSRYIHRNPLEARIVKKADNYPWSSYAAFIGKVTAPPWLTREDTLAMVGLRNC